MIPPYDRFCYIRQHARTDAGYTKKPKEGKGETVNAVDELLQEM